MATINELFIQNKKELLTVPKVKNSSSDEPFIFIDIPTGQLSPLDFVRRYQSRDNPSYALTVDVQRLAKLLKSPRGLKFLAKQSLFASENVFADSRKKTPLRILAGIGTSTQFYADIKSNNSNIDTLVLEGKSLIEPETITKIRNNQRWNKYFKVNDNSKEIGEQYWLALREFHRNPSESVYFNGIKKSFPEISLFMHGDRSYIEFLKQGINNFVYNSRLDSLAPYESTEPFGEENGTRIKFNNLISDKSELSKIKNEYNFKSAYNSIPANAAASSELRNSYGLNNKVQRIDGSGTPFYEYSNDVINTKINSTSINEDFIKVFIKDVVNNKIYQFRSYIDGVSETLTTSNNSIRTIQSNELFYIYGGAQRQLNFNLKLIAHNRTELQSIIKKIDKLKGLVYGFRSTQTNMIKSPIIEITIGNLYKKQPALFNSLQTTINDDYPWDIKENLNDTPTYVPFYYDLSIGLDLIEKKIINKTRNDINQFHQSNI